MGQTFGKCIGYRSRDRCDVHTRRTSAPSESTENHLNAGRETDDDVDFLSDWEEMDWETQPISVNLAEEETEDEEEPSVVIREINSLQYVMGDILAEGATGTIYEATRVKDGMKVVVKHVNLTKHIDYIRIPGRPEALPREIALHVLACEGKFVPEIVQLLDWQLYPDHYVMVLEYPSPCMDLLDFRFSKGGKLYEDLAKDIMWQATMAACMCCRKGVFHRDIKMENLLITTDTLFVKLLDFGCGDVLKSLPYTTFMGTKDYICPEFLKTGGYHGKPATVYSLGTLLFAMLCGKFPNCNDQYSIKERIWYKDGLSEECCDLIETCLQEDPRKRIDLEKILAHKWFQDKYPVDDLQTPILEVDPNVRIEEINGCQYMIGKKLGQGGFGSVHEGTRLHDGLEVAVKFVTKNRYIVNDYIKIRGHPVPLPREVGIHMLACKGENVPVIVQLLDWQDYLGQYIMVLERPPSCEDVSSFVKNKGGRVKENRAQRIMEQVTKAAEICCQRGVVHRDIKLRNLLINPDTLEVKLIDFGCGDLKKTAYTKFVGTEHYICPEYYEKGKYCGKQAAVYSLGVVLFFMVCGKYPSIHDLHLISKRMWYKHGLSKECCDFIQDSLQKVPWKRINLEKILYHKWFQNSGSLNVPQHGIIRRLVGGCFRAIYDPIRSLVNFW